MRFTFHNNISYVAPRPRNIKGQVKFPQTYTHVEGHTKHTNARTHSGSPSPKAWLHQDDSRPLSPPDKDSVSWDDVTAAFLMGVNLCLVEQQQKNLCVALNPHVLGRMKAASALFCFSMWLSPLTLLSLPFLYPRLSELLSCLTDFIFTLSFSAPVSSLSAYFPLPHSCSQWLSSSPLWITPSVSVALSFSLYNSESVAVFFFFLPFHPTLSLGLFSLSFFSFNLMTPTTTSLSHSPC